jgi:SAM-dependent methyltransferase
MQDRTELVREGYDVIAPAYNAGRLAREAVNVEWLDSLAAYLPKKRAAIDLGCGGGVPITRYFAERGWEVTGYDLSEQILDLARQQVPGAAFEQASMVDLELPENSVDLILSFFAIIHVDRMLHRTLFAKLFSWLRPGGAVLLSLGAGDNPGEYNPNWHGAPMTWSHFGAETNLKLLEEVGFQLIWHEVEHMPTESHLFVIAHKQVGFESTPER